MPPPRVSVTAKPMYNIAFMRNPMLLGLALLGVMHCDSSSSPDASVDVAVTDSAAEASAPDVGSDAASMDAGAPDVTPSDVSTGDSVVPDASPGDAVPSDGGALPCESAGGRCVAVTPSACSDGVVGSTGWYDCGGALGVMCCLPRTVAPSCRAIGTRSEGWYRADGERVCFASCAGASVMCANVGTRSEGWYTDVASAGCSDPPVDRLVQWTDCSP